MSILSKIDKLADVAEGIISQVSGTTINSIQPQFSNLVISLGGKKFVGVTAVNWEETVEPGYIKGTSSANTAQTVGTYSASGSMTMGSAWFKQFREGLGDEYLTKLFNANITVSWDGTTTSKIDLVNCRILSLSTGWADSPDVLLNDFNIYIDQVKYDGKVGVKKS